MNNSNTQCPERTIYPSPMATPWEEDISRSGYMTIEKMRGLLHEMVKKVYA